MQNLIRILSLLLISFSCFSQRFPQITHYSTENGLSENHILSMLQDKRGMMWFGTYDGLNSFDGYEFKNYKGNKLHNKLLNFRIEKLVEDHQGYIWLETNDRKIYRFDPATSDFTPFPQCDKAYENYNRPLTRITVLENNEIWLSHNNRENGDCFRIQTINAITTQIDLFSKNNQKLNSYNLNKIYLDSKGTTWLLGNESIEILEKNQCETKILDTIGGYEINEIDSKIYLACDKGIILTYDLISKKKKTVQSANRSAFIDIKNTHHKPLLLLNRNHDIFMFENEKFHQILFDKNKCGKLYSLFSNGSDKIWIDSDYKGSIYFDYDDNSIHYLKAPLPQSVNSTNRKYGVSRDFNKNIWIQTRNNGFYALDTVNMQLHSLPPSGESQPSLSGKVQSALFDKQGNMWLYTSMLGIYKIVFQTSAFDFTKPANNPQTSIENEIRCLFQDHNSQIWVCTKNGPVYIYNTEMQQVGQLSLDGSLSGSIPFNVAVYSMAESKDGTIWLGTRGKGLFKLSPINKNQYKIQNFTSEDNNYYSLSNNSIYSLWIDETENLWIGTFGGGLNCLNLKDPQYRFINSHNQLKNYPVNSASHIRYITEDKAGNLWICTTMGLVVSRIKNTPDKLLTFYQYTLNPTNKNSISGNDVFNVMINRESKVFITTIGGGVDYIDQNYTIENLKFNPLLSTENKQPNAVYTISEVESGDLWMSTQTQLLKFNPKSSEMESYKPLSEQKYYMAEAAVCKTKQGKLIFGTSEGFVHFDPKKIIKNKFIPNIIFTRFKLFNKESKPGEISSPISKVLDATAVIKLSHTQHSFSLEYAATDFTNPSVIQYAYKLEGFESDWNYVGTQRIASYINLPKGKYTFHVKSTNADGVWSENERIIEIIKLPSFWESAWGWMFYVFLFLLLSAIVAYVLFIIYQLRNDVIVEQRIADMKLKFFTDISHELRTPLTLIVSPLERILNKEIFSDNVRGQLETVNKNAQRMLRLVNQLLDFRKIQNHKMKLLLEEKNVALLMQDIIAGFRKFAEDKEIQLNLISQTEKATLWLDTDKFEKIIYNLLSNAIKFSQSGSEISIVLFEDIDYVTISVSDHGTGISKDKLKLLFTRFESFTANHWEKIPGTGIGLSLTRELVDLHKGTIEVESEPGKGSTFKLVFRKGMQHFDKDVEFLLNDYQEESCKNNALNTTDEEVNILEIERSDKMSILIAEDNEELRVFLKKSLESDYDIIEAENGKIALNKAKSIIPDLIVSDIMMPEMDGIELATLIKKDINTSHIPFILLTAKTDLDTRIEAMNLCVDDYIAKPFNFLYLEARICNLLKIRKQLHQYFQNSMTSGIITLEKPEITTEDEKFMNKVVKYLEGHFDDSNMNIDEIATDTGVSRSALFKKLKSLTGLAPVEFVREFRLQKALQFLEAGETTISQLTYNVGMLDTKYFSRCFKQKFGMNPSEYKQHLNNNSNIKPE